MKKLLIYLIPVLAFCLLNITSCKDEAEELPRLFIRGEKRNVSICGRPEND